MMVKVRVRSQGMCYVNKGPYKDRSRVSLVDMCVWVCIYVCVCVA